MNKKRSLITVIGVSISVMFLYMLLNLFLSYLLNYRAYLRENYDFEMVFFTENEQQINDILNDPWVKDGTVADYYKYNYYGSTNYDNALYINTTNPYRINKIFEDIKSKYGVEGRIHYEMAATYLQGDEGNTIYVAILIALLISYIIAIFGVGLIRNSIQLNMLERIKDFGQLRCIGSTKGQMRWIIYLQGLILELGGIICGTVLGVVGSLIVGAVVSWKHTGFHFIPLVFVIVAFLGDLYFAMDENAKLVTKMTPVSAIRGEYRIKMDKRSLAGGKRKQDIIEETILDGKAMNSKDEAIEKAARGLKKKSTSNLRKDAKPKKYKKQSSGIWGRIFGVEGDYAYKNLKRNKGRFRRTVAAMSIGIAAAMLIFGITRSMLQIVRDLNLLSGYYHISNYGVVNPYDSKEQVMKNIPPQDMLAAISSLPGVEKAAQLRMNGALVTDFEEGDGEALILKDMSADGDEESVFTIVSDEKELEAVSGVFADMLEDVEFVQDDDE